MAGDFDVAWLLPDIRNILNNSDKATVSAKAVRKALKERHPSLDVKEHKEVIDRVTIAIFSGDAESLKAFISSSDVKPENVKRERPDDDFPSSPAHPIAKKIVKKMKVPKVETDAEMAARLQREMNGRPSRAGAAPVKAKRASWKKSRKTSNSDDDVDGDAKKRVVSNTGFNKPHSLSQALQDIVGVDQLSRPQVTKQLWVYIKANNLQDPAKKTDILPDEKLRRVFQTDRISSFQMAKHIGVHLYPVQEEVA